MDKFSEFMNIFAVSADVDVCAQTLDNKRVNKMILETAQLLATAVRHNPRILGRTPDYDKLYKETHIAHPCTTWVGENIVNYCWTYDLLMALGVEYGYRNGKQAVDHKTIREQGPLLKPEILTGELPDKWVNCSMFKENPDVFQAYRDTLVAKWSMDRRPPVWSKRQPPDFFLSRKKAG